MLGRSESALYLCLMGTKELRDYLADANLLLRELWQEEGAAPLQAGRAGARDAWREGLWGVRHAVCISYHCRRLARRRHAA